MNVEPAQDATRANSVMMERYFPTLIFYQDLPDAAELNARVKPHIYAWRAADQEGIVRSNVRQVGSWHSGLDMNQREEYRELAERILAMVQEVYERLDYDPVCEAACDNMWAIVNPRYAYNRSHTHPGVLWSGVYYVQTPPDSGRIFFTDPRSQAQVIRPRLDPNKPLPAEAWSEVYYQPIEGRVLLFPAWLLHEVEPNLSDREGPEGDRISVAFNVYQRQREAVV